MPSFVELNETVWYNDGQKVNITDSGIKVKRIPFLLGLTIAGGVGLTLWYMFERKSIVELEDLLQTALAIVALYSSSIVVIVYQLFHRDEDLNDVIYFEQHLDSLEEFNRLSIEQRAVVVLRLLNEFPSGKDFVKRMNASFVRDSGQGGCMFADADMEMGNLFVPGFKFLRMEKVLFLVIRDGSFGRLHQNNEKSERAVYCVAWAGREEILPNECEPAVPTDWGYVL